MAILLVFLTLNSIFIRILVLETNQIRVALTTLTICPTRGKRQILH